MFPKPNYKWRCKKCGEEMLDREEKESIVLSAFPPKCSKCGEEMEGGSIIKGGPFPENPFKKE